jgi:hypothetical protein
MNMHPAFARKQDVEHWDHAPGFVQSKQRDGIRVVMPGVTLTMRRALSCLAEPEVGDRVLVTRSGAGTEAYVIAVLDRDGDAPLALASPGDMEVRAAGKLSVVAEEAMIAAPSFSLHSVRARLHATHLIAVLGSVEALLDRVVQRAKQAFRVIEGVDHLRAAQIDYEATGTMSLHAENAAMTSEGLVKIDGEQIQLG